MYPLLKRERGPLVKATLSIALYFLVNFCVLPSAMAEVREVVVTGLTGEVDYMKGGAGDWLQIEKEAVLQETDVVRTGAKSTCSLLFKGMSNSTVEMKPDSVLELSTVSDTTGDDTELGLSIGSVLVKAEKLNDESSFQVRTPNSIVGIRGTEFEVNVD